MKNIELEELDSSIRDSAEEIVNKFSILLGGVRPDFYIKNRPDGPYLIFEFASPSEQHYKMHNGIVVHLSVDSYFKDRSTVQPRKVSPKERLALPETQILKKVIAESLTIDRHSFNEDFFSRYTASVATLEQQITTKANFVVYGRRGAGKSSLLAYAMHTSIKNRSPYCWVAMQTYEKRSDNQVVPAVLAAILYDLVKSNLVHGDFDDLIKSFDSLSESDDALLLQKCDRLIPRARRALGEVSSADCPITIFLDDIHVLAKSIQPLVLSFVYKISRGNNVYIKASGIAQLTTLWDAATNSGLQPPHDAQILNLDLNLTMPDRSKEHIVNILDSHARYCGLPSISYLANGDVLSRLVLVAAGVPRDSLNLFSIAISKAFSKHQQMVSVTSVNGAASEMVEEKLKDIEKDNSEDLEGIRTILSEVKCFCVDVHRKNSFLVEIVNSDVRYNLIQKLVALRLVHLLHEGITPHKAGQRFIALMLDYGFYVGIRASRSVDFIPEKPHQLSAKELRSLPIFR